MEQVVGVRPEIKSLFAKVFKYDGESVALYNKQLLWDEWEELKSGAVALMEFMGRPIGIAILFVQLSALVAFWNRSLLLVLFALYDLMHVGIFLLVGANFVAWFMLNVAIIAAVGKLQPRAFNWQIRLKMTGVDLACNTAYDSRLAD